MNRLMRVIATLVIAAIAAGCTGATASSAPPTGVAPPEADPPSTTAPVIATVETTTTTTSPPSVSTSIDTPEPVRSAVADDPGCYVELARAVGWPEETLGHLAFIMRRESGCDPSAFADRPWTLDLSRGLLQINAYGSLDAGIRRICGIDPVTLFDPTVNLTCGLAMWRAMGWAPWGE